jgi:two-component system NtrC family sensor kinase
MNEVVCAKLFDPFFTTKRVGKGTGLGISISYQIVVKKHGGTLTYQSSRGQGTEFIIELPILGKTQLTSRSDDALTRIPVESP